MAKKKPERRQVGLDPAVATAMGIEREKTYQERKVDYDRDRVRLRLDVPAWLKSAIEQESKAQRVSLSQLGAFLMAYALKLYRDGEPDLLEFFERGKTRITSLRWAFGVDLSDLEEILNGFADDDEKGD